MIKCRLHYVGTNWCKDMTLLSVPAKGEIVRDDGRLLPELRYLVVRMVTHCADADYISLSVVADDSRRDFPDKQVFVDCGWRILRREE